MLIRVMCQNEKFDFVKPFLLDEHDLLYFNKIKKFLRSEEWVDPNVDKIRGVGVITNFLSPHPYLFWMVVGAPTVLKAYKTNFLSVLLFIFSFYFLLVGSKIFVALLVDKSKAFLKSNVYIYTIKSLGFILIILAALFIKDGLKFFGVF